MAIYPRAQHGEFWLFHVKDEKIADVKYKTFGCVAAIAVSGWVSEMTKGKTLEEVKAISKKAVTEALDELPNEKMRCSNLGAQALSEAVDHYEVTAIVRSKKCYAKLCMNCGEKIN